VRINIFPIPEADAYRWGCHKRKPYEVGYESVSRFNREYSRFFAQLPCAMSNRLEPLLLSLHDSIIGATGLKPAMR